MTKIEKVETFLWSRWLLIKIHSEDGYVGVGEGGVHGWQRPTNTWLAKIRISSSTTTSTSIVRHTSWARSCKALSALSTSRSGT